MGEPVRSGDLVGPLIVVAVVAVFLTGLVTLGYVVVRVIAWAVP